jgi:formylglycine-generating enzyme required for sulfatase activity
MAGNVWERTSSLYKPYPYKADDGRNNPSTGDGRVLRGGAFDNDGDDVRCACRGYFNPDLRLNHLGFRVVAPSL